MYVYLHLVNAHGCDLSIFYSLPIFLGVFIMSHWRSVIFRALKHRLKVVCDVSGAC
jgi:hypothetical protein